ncbi:MAG: hypothetical protein JNM50_04870 [Chromatiales bacterium]|jgi:hypothetical protein|nr:hypothetical protein [Chromatiales bacterium]
MKDSQDPMVAQKRHRAVTAVFGIFLLGLAAAVIASSDSSTRLPAALAAVALAVLGVDALVSAVRGRRAWVSRLGPLP